MKKVTLTLIIGIGFLLQSLFYIRAWADNGEPVLKWTFDIGWTEPSSPVVGFDGSIYIGTGYGNLYAINPNGTQKWLFQTGGLNTPNTSPAIGSDGTIYIGTYDWDLYDKNLFYAINPDGTQKWLFQTGSPNASPTIGSDGTIYVGTSDGNLYAINPDGTQKWLFQTGPNAPKTSPTIGSDGTIYVGTSDGNLYAINPDGTQKWLFQTGGQITSPVISSDGIIYVGTSDGNLHAINPDGTQKWTFGTEDEIYFSPNIGLDGTVYVGTYDGNLYAINPGGTQKWTFGNGDWVYTSPNIGLDGTIYVVTLDGNLYAINLDGTQKWVFKTNCRVNSSAIISPDGTIYLDSDTKLYAVTPPSLLNVTITPQKAIDEGAQWRIDGSEWFNSGKCPSNIDSGQHLVEFKSLSGWKEPNALYIEIVLDEVITVTGTYELLSELIYYKISEIPPQTVYHGNTLKFIILSEQPASITVNGEPKGKIDFDTATGFFSYTPNAEDKEPFSITFNGMSDGNSTSQTIDFNPIPRLPDEEKVFGTDPLDPPDEADTNYVKKEIVTSDTAENFNYIDRKTRKISISGKKIIFEKGYLNNLYDDFNNKDDIKEMNIYAETLIIRNTLRLPQTVVTIHAKELRFEDISDVSCIDTTPLSKNESPGNNEEGFGKDGLSGLNAVDMNLYIQSFRSDYEHDRFVLKGGNGQEAGKGTPGADGESRNGYYNDPGEWQYRVTYIRHLILEIYCEHSILGICTDYEYRWVFDFDYGTTEFPTSAIQAKSAGKPGNGGNGGNFRSTLNLTSYVENSGGIAGLKGPDYRAYHAGRPNPAYHLEWKGDYYVIGSQTQKGADSVPALNPDLYAGSTGQTETIEKPMSWLTPYALRIVINHAKDAYLYKRNPEYAKKVFEEYTLILDGYSASDEWNSLSDEWKTEFEQMNQEMKVLLHRLYNHLDYFGNPAGWVPMLSLEVNKTAYEDEINHAFGVLYLAYWIGNAGMNIQNKIDGMTAVRDKIKDEIEKFKEEYSKAIKLIPELQQESNKMVLDIESLQNAIQVREQFLIQQAEKIVAERNKVPKWKKIAQIASKICMLCPVGQPYVGKVGEGLDVALKYDPEKPLESADGVIKLFKKSNFKDITDKWDKAIKEIDFFDFPDSIGECDDYYKNQVKPLEEFFEPIGDELMKIKDVLKITEAPRNEVEAELQRLKAESPEFNELIDDISELMARKEEFARKLAVTMQMVSTLSNNITHNLLAIDELNREITEKKEGLDQRTLMYLDEMERRAKERLLKYHYYMAKAYEYRMLEQYDEELNLDDLLEECKTMAETASGLDLKTVDFKSLKNTYIIPINNIKETIIDDYNQDGRREDTTYRIFDLTSEEIQELNAGNPVNINLIERARIRMSDENVRINDIEVKYLDAHLKENASGWYDSRFRVEHAGVSRLSLDGAIYQFKHYNDNTENPISWKAEYHTNGKEIEELETVFESDASKSLLTIFLGDDIENMLFYSRPAAWADITITKTGDKEIVVDNISLKLTYDFFERKDTDQLGVYVMEPENGMKPYIIVDSEDINGRQDGRGNFRRSYYKGDEVTLKAPADYGVWKFQGWDIISGDSSRRILRRVPTRTITIALKDDMVIQPVYSYGNNGEGDVNGDGFITLQDAILALKIICGLDTSFEKINFSANVDGDNKIGMPESVYILQEVSEMRH